jgi:hypothetical protein
MNNNSNILQNSNRILSAIESSLENGEKKNHTFSGLSSVSQENVLYHQSRIYFNMFGNRKDSDEIGPLLSKCPESIERVCATIEAKRPGQLANSKQSGSSHPNNSTNTGVHNANFSESSKLPPHQPVLKKAAGTGPGRALPPADRPVADFARQR